VSRRGQHVTGAVLAARAAGRGFTLLEITLVLFIIAIGSAIAVPMVGAGLDAREVRRAARQIASTMHFCRTEAMAEGAPQALVIDARRNRLHTTGWGRWAVLTDRAIIEQIEGGRVIGDDVVQVLFFPNGSTSGARVVLARRSDRTKNRLAVYLDPLLGTVRVGDADA